ncbi:sulfotransferase [Maritalea mobilis]|uniref:tetratricopeptide repeat-containing sulfotransferase family protein n=1 Tax=Maritalea mobilis TaxID=483324 RepID=UPI001C9456BB|nr:tetratricopeptide repeat-containing sulfotransferase family protein [Maritalea mobilis]MBY6201173.1 sulfotransferase [Maritalea mobilis]
MLPPRKEEVAPLYQRALKFQQSGQVVEAQAIYERLLLAVPRQAEVLFQLGRIEAQSGRLDRAERHLRKALQTKPREAAIWQALHGVLRGGARKKLEREATKAGILLGQASDVQPIMRLLSEGKPEEAEKRAIALFKAAPAASAPAHALGLARMARGHWAAAAEALKVALSRDPENASYKADLARALARTGRPKQAEKLLEEAAVAGLNVAADLARLYRESCRFEDAAIWSAKAVKFSPRDIPTLMAHAGVLAELRKPEEARKSLAAALKAGGQPQRLKSRLAWDLETAGEHDAGLQLLNDALSDAPKDPLLLTQRAQMLQTAGDLSGAETDLRAAIDAAPDHAEAYRAYVNGKKLSADDPLLARMEEQLGNPSLDAAARRTLNFAAAKAKHDLARYGEAAEHLDRANRLAAQAFPYGFDADLAEARLLVEDWHTHLRDAETNGPADPVLFVTGLPRSGTTLVETILAAHSRVTAAGELPFLGRALAPAIEQMRAGAADDSAFAEAGERYLRAARRRTGPTDIIADKAISTFSRIGHAARALPGARFVVLRRDPRDVGLSIWRNFFPEGLHRYAYDLTQMGRYIRLHDALVQFWTEELPDRVLVLEYEELTAQPEAEIRKLIAFAGLDWEDACLSPETANRAIKTLSFATARQPIGRDAVAGWRHYEEALEPLVDALSTSVDLSRVS